MYEILENLKIPVGVEGSLTVIQTDPDLSKFRSIRKLGKTQNFSLGGEGTFGGHLDQFRSRPGLR